MLVLLVAWNEVAFLACQLAHLSLKLAGEQALFRHPLPAEATLDIVLFATQSPVSQSACIAPSAFLFCSWSLLLTEILVWRFARDICTHTWINRVGLPGWQARLTSFFDSVGSELKGGRDSEPYSKSLEGKPIKVYAPVLDHNLIAIISSRFTHLGTASDGYDPRGRPVVNTKFGLLDTGRNVFRQTSDQASA